MRLKLPALVALFLVLLTPLTPRVLAQGAPGMREVQIARDAFSIGDPVPDWVSPIDLPPASGTPPRLVRLVDHQIRVADAPISYSRRALTANDAAALRELGQFTIGFVPDYETVQLHFIRLHRGGEIFDRTSTAAIRFLQRETELDQGIYSGVVTASILLEDVRPGDTVDYAFSRSGQNPVFAGRYFGQSDWGWSVPIDRRHTSISFPASRPLAWRLIGNAAAPMPPPSETRAAGMIQWEFDARAPPPIPGQEGLPPDYTHYPWLQFSEFADWNAVARWADGLFRGDAQAEAAAGEVLRPTLDALRALPDAAARVSAALSFVQSEIRYVSVSLGESSHRPAPPALVLARRYGDCKDKSFLLVTILRALGIEADPVLVRLGRRTGLDARLPDPGLFDHAIVHTVVDGRSYFLDPTRLGQFGKLDRMGQAHGGAQVLVVNPATTGITTIPPAVAGETVVYDVRETARLARFDGAGELEQRHELIGLTAENMRRAVANTSQEDFRRFLVSAMERRYPGTRMLGEPEFRDNRVDNVVTITSRYSLPGMAVDSATNWTVRFSPAHLFGVLPARPATDRAVPLAIPSYPVSGRYSFEIVLPEEVSVMLDPSTTTIETPQFVYTTSRAFRGNNAKVQMRLDVLADAIPVDGLARFSQAMRQLDQAFQTAFFMNKADLKTNGDGAPSGLSERLRARVRESVTQVSATISAGKQRNADLVAAYCTRSYALGDLGDTKASMADADAAVKLAPNSPVAAACRGTAAYIAGAFERSVAEFARAIVLGDTSASVYRHRGIALGMLGRFEDAAEDFLAASERGDDSRPYDDLWLIWTYQRLGRALPADVRARAAAGQNGDWPGPAAAMLAGVITPGQMLATLDAKAGDDRTMALAEAYFYIGQNHLARGENAQAKAMFEKTRSLDVFLYAEHIAAGFELTRLAR